MLIISWERADNNTNVNSQASLPSRLLTMVRRFHSLLRSFRPLLASPYMLGECRQGCTLFQRVAVDNEDFVAPAEVKEKVPREIADT